MVEDIARRAGVVSERNRPGGADVRGMKRRRREKTSSLGGTVLGVAWYSRADWQRLREAVPDADRLEETYEEWVSMATAALAEMKAAGISPERVPVDAEEFLAWCRAGRRAPDSSARAQFSAEKLRQRHLGEPGRSDQ